MAGIFRGSPDPRSTILAQIGQNLGAGVGQAVKQKGLTSAVEGLTREGLTPEGIFQRIAAFDPEFAKKNLEATLLAKGKENEKSFVQSITLKAVEAGALPPEALEKTTTLPQLSAAMDAFKTFSPQPEKPPTPDFEVVVDESSPTGYSFRNLRDLSAPLVPNAPPPRSGVTVNVGAKPASAQERTDIADARASLDSLANLKGMFDPAYVGPIAGRAGKVKDLFGGNTQAQSEFNAATAAFKNAIIKQITGAQMSEPEAKRIMKQVPDVNDPPSVWLARWQQSVKNIEFMEKRRLEVLRQSGLKVPENKDLSTLSDDELFNVEVTP